MPKEKYLKSLKKAMEESSEQLIFRELEEVSSIPGSLSVKPGDYQVNLKVEEPFKGKLVMFFEHLSAERMITEMLGEIVHDHDKIVDGLAEFSNAFWGRFLAHYVPADQHYSMGIPQLFKINNSKQLPNYDVWAFRFGDLNIYAALQEE